MSRKNAAAASNALSIAKYIHNYPGMPEGAKAVMHHLKLDLVACCNFLWREAHNKMLLCRSIALDCLRKDFTSDRRGSEIGSPPCSFQRNHSFRRGIGETPRGEHEACCDIRCVPYANSAPVSYSSCPYVARGKSFSDRAGPCQLPLSLGLARLRKASHL